MTGLPFHAVLHDDDRVRTTAVSELLASVAGPDVRVVRVGNPLRSPLTLDRILMQVAGPDGDVILGQDATVVQAITRRQAQETRVLLVIEQADTLHPAALRSLQAMTPHFKQDGQPALRVAFVGRTAFRGLLAGEGLAPMRAALGISDKADDAVTLEPAPSVMTARQFQPATPALPEPDRPAVATHEAPAKPVPARSGRWLLRAVLVLAVLGGAVAASIQGLRSLFYRDVPPRPALATVIPAPALTPQPDPPAVVPTAPLVPAPALLPPEPAPPAALPPVAAPAPVLPTVITPPLPPTDQTARLRRDFETFLARSGLGIATLTDAQRDVLFDEFLEWRAQNPGNANPREPGPRIVIHVPAGSVEAGTVSNQLLTMLRPRPGTVEARPVADGPARPTINFYHPDDEAAARQAAGWMADAGLAWTVRDLTSFQPRPPRGLIEVWLPDR